MYSIERMHIQTYVFGLLSTACQKLSLFFIEILLFYCFFIEKNHCLSADIKYTYVYHTSWLRALKISVKYLHLCLATSKSVRLGPGLVVANHNLQIFSSLQLLSFLLFTTVADSTEICGLTEFWVTFWHQWTWIKIRNFPPLNLRRNKMMYVSSMTLRSKEYGI